MPLKFAEAACNRQQLETLTADSVIRVTTAVEMTETRCCAYRAIEVWHKARDVWLKSCETWRESLLRYKEVVYLQTLAVAIILAEWRRGITGH